MAERRNIYNTISYRSKPAEPMRTASPVLGGSLERILCATDGKIGSAVPRHRIQHIGEYTLAAINVLEYPGFRSWNRCPNHSSQRECSGVPRERYVTFLLAADRLVSYISQSVSEHFFTAQLGLWGCPARSIWKALKQPTYIYEAMKPCRVCGWRWLTSQSGSGRLRVLFWIRGALTLDEPCLETPKAGPLDNKIWATKTLLWILTNFQVSQLFL